MSGHDWHAFDLDLEYKRMISSSDDWRVSNANKDFALCPTYPTKILVPKSVSDECLIKVTQFRCLGRLPILSYLHKQTKAVIVRSSQPMVGPQNKRCREDERMLNAIIGSKRGYIIETRSQNVAQLAKTKGGGYEPETYYPLLRRVHRPIDRHQVLADSLHKLAEACLDKNCTTDKWLSRLETSNWLKQVTDVLTCACLVAQCVAHEGASVLVHGSEGMDSTLQVTSLAQVILDPDCRSILGFQALIEREWIQAGHPFKTRCKLSAFSPTSGFGTIALKDHSPVFMLFLDCVAQILHQFPCSFEFDDSFLILLLDHAYASEFATFSANSQKERQENNFGSRTSLWSYINRPEVLTQYLNPAYEPNFEATWPSVAPQSIDLWEYCFFRWTFEDRYQAKARERMRFLRTQIRQNLSNGDRHASDKDHASTSSKKIADSPATT